MPDPALYNLEVGTDHAVPIEPQGGSALVTVDNTGGTVYWSNSLPVSAGNNQGSIAPGGSQTFTNPVWLIASSLAGVTVQVTSIWSEWAQDNPLALGSGGGIGDTSTDPTSPIQAPASPRNRALRDFLSVLDYGTYTSGDMTSTWTAALAAAHNKGSANGVKFKLLVPPNNYQITSLTGNVSYVDMHAHGASVTRLSSYTTNQAFFWGPPITQFALRGLTVIGTGTETAFQCLLYTGQSSHITIEDCEASGSATSLVNFEDSDHLWVYRNKVLNGGTAGGYNAINFINAAHGSTNPLKHVWARENIVENFATIGICLVSKDGATRTDPDMDAHVNDNTCSVSGAGWPIAVEQGGTTTGGAPNVKNIDISGNTCVQNGTGLYALAVTNDSTPLSNDPLCISGVTARGNRLFSLGAGGVGLLCLASRASINGNYIEATVDDIKLQGHGTAVINNIAITGNVGHLGTGKHININPGNGTTTGGVDTTTLTSSNTQ
jgi:hypothetical protein